MGEAANNFSLGSARRAQSLTGKISIAASEPYAAFILPPVLTKLRDRAPNIEIGIIASNQSSDLKRREADIAIRNFRPSEPDLIAKKLEMFPLGFMQHLNI